MMIYVVQMTRPEVDFGVSMGYPIVGIFRSKKEASRKAIEVSDAVGAAMVRIEGWNLNKNEMISEDIY